MNTNEKIIELLTEIKDELKEIKQTLQDDEVDDEEREEITCDQCGKEFASSQLYKRVNKFDFCSKYCWDEWKEIK